MRQDDEDKGCYIKIIAMVTKGRNLARRRTCTIGFDRPSFVHNWILSLIHLRLQNRGRATQGEDEGGVKKDEN